MDSYVRKDTMKDPKTKKRYKKQDYIIGTRTALPSPNSNLCVLLECFILQTGAPCAIGRCHCVKVPYSCPHSSATIEERVSVSQHPHTILELYVDTIRQGYESKRLDWPDWISPCAGRRT